MFFCSFNFLTKAFFLLAQILMRADLGDEPEHPLELVIQPSRAGRHEDAAGQPNAWARLATLSGSDTRSRCQRFGFPRRFGLSGGISGPRFRLVAAF